MPLNLTALQRKCANATVIWTDPEDGEEIVFTVTYAPHRYSSRVHNELGRLKATADEARAALDGEEAPESSGVTLDDVFDALLNVLGGRPGDPDSGLLLDWDVVDGKRKVPFSRSILEGFPLDLLFAITGAIMGDAGNRRRGASSASTSAPTG